jgi:predicted transcriptional regulator of viral defense system
MESRSNYRYPTVSSRALDAAVAEQAAKRHGNVTRRQLLSLGLDDAAIARRVAGGRLYRVHRGVYAVGRPPVTPLERASAAVLACGSGAALSHSSAMTLWGYWRHWDDPLELVVLGDRRVPGLRVHTSTTLRRRDLTTQAGIRVTTAARTVFDISPRLNDKALKRTVNNALHSLWLNESDLVELVTRLAHLAPAHRIAPLIGLPGTPTRSGWEDEFPAFCAVHGLPEPVMGAPLCGYIVDALFVDAKLIVELDSKDSHNNAIAFGADRERDAETLAHGFATVRITWERIHEAPAKEAARLGAILARRREAAA